jgi:hypothetical protein
MFIAILQHTPVWVWTMLAVLTAFGLSQVRDRQVGLARVTVVPLVLVALSAGGVLSAFGHSAIAVSAWFVGIAGSLVFARKLIAARGASWSAQTSTLHVPGSWLPLVLMLGLFAIKYFAGVSLALHPALATDSEFAGLCGLAYGVFAGMFLGRSLSLRSLAKSPVDLQAA